MGKKVKSSAVSIEMRAVEELEKNIHPKNPRVHPESAINKLVSSIKEFGWTNPILLDQEGRVIAGHARLAAARKAGLTEVPTIKLNFAGRKADAYLIADNRLQQDTFWDPNMLKDMLADLKHNGGFDLITGFELFEINAMFKEGPAVEPEKKKTKTRDLIRCPECGHEF